MKHLVDALYYDYVLYKLACLYTADNKNDAIVQYQKIAQKLLLKLRAEKAVLDAEAGLKFAYIKLYDLHLSFPKCVGRLHASCCQKHYSQFLATCHSYLSKIMNEYSALREYEVFRSLFKFTTLLFVFSFPSLSYLKEVGEMEKAFLSIKPYLAKQGINFETEDEFQGEKRRFTVSLDIKASSDNEVFNQMLGCMMEWLKKVFLSFSVPALQFFATREAMQLKEVYPEAFEGVSGVPDSKREYRQEIITDYLDLRNSLNKIKGIFINPKDKGEKVAWNSQT